MENQIKVLRERVSLSQAELAKLLDVDHATVSRWEAGTVGLTPATIARLARVFKVETWQILTNRAGLRPGNRPAQLADGGAA